VLSVAAVDRNASGSYFVSKLWFCTIKLGIAPVFVTGLTKQSVNGTVLTGVIELVVELDVVLEVLDEVVELLVTGGAEEELVVLEVVTMDVVVVDFDDSEIAA
jgi:hypothetical protein